MIRIVVFLGILSSRKFNNDTLNCKVLNILSKSVDRYLIDFIKLNAKIRRQTLLRTLDKKIL